MDCKQVTRLIPYAADGELDERLSGPFQTHIESCTACSNALAVQKSLINDLEFMLHEVSLDAVASDDFASSVVSKVKEYADSHSLLDRITDRVAALLPALSASKRLVATISCAAVVAATLVVGCTALRMLDSAPVASTKVNPGHLVVFTVRPAPGGKVVAGVDSRSYCQVTRATEEALR